MFIRVVHLLSWHRIVLLLFDFRNRPVYQKGQILGWLLLLQRLNQLTWLELVAYGRGRLDCVSKVVDALEERIRHRITFISP